MNPLPAPVSPSAILSFDFDGTLHDPAQDPPVPPAFFELLRKLREEQGVIWGINTGRSLAQIMEGFIESRFQFLPDWVVARECEIYTPSASGQWLPHTGWNLRCETEIHSLFKRANKLLDHVRREIESHTGAKWQEMNGEIAGIISQSDEEMDWIVDHIRPLVASEPHLAWQRNSIYLRFGHRDYHKGSSLSEIAGQYGLTSAQTFAIGDGQNDFEMLDPVHAAMTSCPTNAVATIKEKIAANNGLITKAAHGYGSIEALFHYFKSR
ncbi:MAG: HAD family phosphatase, partial [Armatimonadetes bacterium]|nr:HAD family phosphatase [Akkermansiaceae bacterium]